jgi:hypothetical protein
MVSPQWTVLTIDTVFSVRYEVPQNKPGFSKLRNAVFCVRCQLRPKKQSIIEHRTNVDICTFGMLSTVNLPARDIWMLFDCESVGEVRRGVTGSVAIRSALLRSAHELNV